MGEDEGKICFNCAAWHGEGDAIRWCAVWQSYKYVIDACDEFEPKKQNGKEISKNG